MKKRLLMSLLGLSLTVMAISFLLGQWGVRRSSIQMLGDTLRQKARHMQEQGVWDTARAQASLAFGERLTLIGEDGTVLFDSQHDKDTMQNHRLRKEVMEALAGTAGIAVRASDTAKTDMVYVALPPQNGAILRLAAPLVMAKRAAESVLALYVPALLPLLAGLAALSYHLTERMMKPVRRMDAARPVETCPYPEMMPLAVAMEREMAAAEKRVKALKKARLVTEDILSAMTDGMMLVSREGLLLHINDAAARVLGWEREKAQGMALDLVAREKDVFQALQYRGEGARQMLTARGRAYEVAVRASRGEVQGYAVHMKDVTEKVNLENMRRRFTSDVSHELKTPLTTLMGYAEMLKEGLIPQEDVAGVAERMYRENTRLLAMVEDILLLGKLDEGTLQGAFEAVPLHQVAGEALKALENKARLMRVRLESRGQAAEVPGNRALLYSLVLNLADNAVKYSKPDTVVRVSVQKREDGVLLTVQDAGIGIPQAHLPRVFERFYRVEQSRSQDLGGTGLGLSIVKHIALLHRAAIDIQSEENVGTTVTVRFGAAERH